MESVGDMRIDRLTPQRLLAPLVFPAQASSQTARERLLLPSLPSASLPAMLEQAEAPACLFQFARHAQPTRHLGTDC